MKIGDAGFDLFRPGIPTRGQPVQSRRRNFQVCENSIFPRLRQIRQGLWPGKLAERVANRRGWRPRRSLLVFFQFPFRHAEDRFDNWGRPVRRKRNWRLPGGRETTGAIEQDPPGCTGCPSDEAAATDRARSWCVFQLRIRARSANSGALFLTNFHSSSVRSLGYRNLLRS